MISLILVAMVNSPFPQQAQNSCRTECLNSYKQELVKIFNSKATKEEQDILDKYLTDKLKECKAVCEEDEESDVADVR